MISSYFKECEEEGFCAGYGLTPDDIMEIRECLYIRHIPLLGLENLYKKYMPSSIHSGWKKPSAMVRFGEVPQHEKLVNDTSLKQDGYSATSRRSYGEMLPQDVKFPTVPDDIKNLKNLIYSEYTDQHKRYLKETNSEDSVVIFNYYKDSSISAHRDSPANGDYIPVLNLRGAAYMIFCRKKDYFLYPNECFYVSLVPGQLTVMSYELLTDWFHCVTAPTSKDGERMSIVFRHIPKG